MYGVAFSPDDLFVVSASQDGTARLWGLTQRACLVRYVAHASPVWGVAFAQFGSYFVTTGYDRTARVWSVEHTQPLRLLRGHQADVRCAAFHPNVSLVATGGDDTSVRLWDWGDDPSATPSDYPSAKKNHPTAKCVRLLCTRGHTAAVCCLAIADDGRHLASGGEDHVAVLWDLASGEAVRRLSDAHSKPVWSVAFSAEGAQLASGSADGSIAIWDAHATIPADANADAEADAGGAGSLLRRVHTKFTPVLAVTFSRANLLLAAGSYQPPGPATDDCHKA